MGPSARELNIWIHEKKKSFAVASDSLVKKLIVDLVRKKRKKSGKWISQAAKFSIVKKIIENLDHS